MNTNRNRLLAVMMIAVLAGCSEDDTVPAAPVTPIAPRPADNSSNAVILEWDRILTENLPGGGNLFSYRLYAMLHIAMFDAVNSIHQRYRPYVVEAAAAAPWASAEAAAAQAARDVLVALIPAATTTFDAALATRLATIESQVAAQGVTIGKQAAAAVIQWRTGDGSASADTPYLPPALPGLWQPTAGQVAAGTRYANIKPFALVSATQFLPSPPPPLNSATYATDYQQVYELGRVDSVLRTPDQTQLALVVAGPPNYSPNPFQFWSLFARTQISTRNLGIADTARAFAMMNAALHDGLQTSHTSKYVYGLWRPLTAIQRADEDANTGTISDPTWTPLLTTPPYPSHASNLTCIAVSASRALERVLGGDAMNYQVTWKWVGAAGGSDVTRSYTSLSQLADEAAMSRVYGGIHFKFELDAAAASCRKVADYVCANYMGARG